MKEFGFPYKSEGPGFDFSSPDDPMVPCYTLPLILGKRPGSNGSLILFLYIKIFDKIDEFCNAI